MNVHGFDPAAAIRAALRDDVPGIAAVHVASWHESYTGIIDQRLIDERPLEVRMAQWRQTIDQPGRVTYVANDERGSIWGFTSALVLSGRPEAFDSYLQLLYLVARAQGRGVGKALLQAVAAELVARGCRTMVLRVLRANPARGFYEALGAQLEPRGLEIDGGIFDDVIYRFGDLRLLAAPR